MSETTTGNQMRVLCVLVAMCLGCANEQPQVEPVAKLEPSGIDPRVAWDGSKWVTDSNIASSEMETMPTGGVVIRRTYKDGSTDAKEFTGPGWRGRAKAYDNEMPSLFPFGGFMDGEGNRLPDDAP